MDNQTMMQYFEWNLPSDGLLWERLRVQAKALKASGIDMIWLPPAYKGHQGAEDVGYGVYDLYDLGEFDQKGSVRTKYGTREEYLRAVHTLRDEGISVMADIVMNHLIGADETERVMAARFDPNNRTQQIAGAEEIEAWTRFTYPARKQKHSAFTWDHTNFTAVDWDEKRHAGGIYLFEGKEWSVHVSSDKGNYDYLMGANVDTENPVVEAELLRWGRWYAHTTGIEGYRLDAVKHVSFSFFRKWLDNIREEMGHEAFAVGEYWTDDLGELLGYLHETDERMHLFDVPLHFAFARAANGNGAYDMGSMFNDTLVAANKARAVTFVDNHDSQPGQALASWIESWFKPLAYALILLRQDGLPCVFYADYYGLRDDGVPAVPGLKRMIRARRLYAYGPQHDYFDHHDIVGWTREGDDMHEHSGLAVLMSDAAAGSKRMYIGKQHGGRTMRDITRRAQDVITVGEDGYALFNTQSRGVSVYLFEEAYRFVAMHLE